MPRHAHTSMRGWLGLQGSSTISATRSTSPALGPRPLATMQILEAPASIPAFRLPPSASSWGQPAVLEHVGLGTQALRAVAAVLGAQPGLQVDQIVDLDPVAEVPLPDLECRRHHVQQLVVAAGQDGEAPRPGSGSSRASAFAVSASSHGMIVRPPGLFAAPGRRYQATGRPAGPWPRARWCAVKRAPMRVAILDDYQQVALARHGLVRGARASRDYRLHRAHRQDRGAGAGARAVPRRGGHAGADGLRRRAAVGRLPPRLLVTTGMANAAIAPGRGGCTGITVCGTDGSATSTVELTWGLILALARHIPGEDQRMKAAGRAGGAAISVGGGWQRTVGTGLAGKRLGVVGLGFQGRKVAKIGRAFGMELLAWSQNLDPERARKAHAQAVSKEELFSSADVVTVHYKLSPRSTGLVGAAELALMKPSAFLVNTSRGPIVDRAALLTALRSGSIAGAALDVFDTEPLPLSDPLRTAPNVILTPHLGYVTDDAYRVFYQDAAEDIVAFSERLAGAGAQLLAFGLPRWVAARQAQRGEGLAAVPRWRPPSPVLRKSSACCSTVARTAAATASSQA